MDEKGPCIPACNTVSRHWDLLIVLDELSECAKVLQQALYLVSALKKES